MVLQIWIGWILVRFWFCLQMPNAHKQLFGKYLTIYSRNRLDCCGLDECPQQRKFQYFEIFKNQMHFNKEQVKSLTINTVAILALYLVVGVLQQHLIKFQYVNDRTGKNEKFPHKLFIVMAPALVTWLLGSLYNKRKIEQKTYIPEKNSMWAGLCVFTSTTTYTYAAVKTSFPIIMAVKSCNLLSVLLVAVLCTRVREKSLLLGPKKIIMGIIVTIGVFLFTFFQPDSEKKGRTDKSQFLGIVLLITSLLADGFLPDFQAEIKAVYKPQPTEMMEHINKWITIFSGIWIVVTLEVFDIAHFIVTHRQFLFHITVFSLCCFFGQIFVYRTIKQFKQHIVPFVVTVRKVLTVILSIIFYHHSTSFLQVLGMLIIFGTTFMEFAFEVRQNVPQPEKFEQVVQYSEQIETERGQLHPEEGRGRN